MSSRKIPHQYQPTFRYAFAQFSYKKDNPAFSWKRMDEGPILNNLGLLMVVLNNLGLKTPREVLEGNTRKPKYYEKL